MTPDQFALTLAHDLDLPNTASVATQISSQIRQQLEEYAGVALHPLFHTAPTTANGTRQRPVLPARITSREQLTSGAVGSTPLTNGIHTNGHPSPAKQTPTITALATPLSPSPNPAIITTTAAPAIDHNPDDTYRCLISLNINLQSHLYSDKFEWSLLHPPGAAEAFSSLTCSDLGLAPEWVPIMTHAIYEAVLRLKKEACESGGLIAGEIDNLAAEGKEAGWRFDNEHLADEWEAKLETLSKEEIEKREGDRERQIRRQRRETARFSSNATLGVGLTPGAAASQPGYFDNPVGDADTPMGRGERSKRKRRFRSLSPTGRGTPGARGTPDAGGANGVAGYGGGGGLTDW
jgi:chromatin structure-remodeling complex subunit SFH1